MDEASAKLRMEINSKPEELDAMDRKIMQLEIEIEAIKREKDAQKLKNLNCELANLKEDRSVIYGQWSAERGLIERIQQHKAEIENLRLQPTVPNVRAIMGKSLSCATERLKMSKSN